MVEAATEFKKSGYSDDDAAQLALVAQMYRNVADEQIDAGTAANFIVSQMKAFNLTAEDSQHIIDAVNEVSNNYAVSSSDLARNIGNASAAMAAGGNTMEETLGMMTAMTEITRSGSKASRGLVTIQSRYNQILDESSSTGKKLTDFYTQHGIQLRDESGQLRSMYDVLGDLSSKWGGLTDDEKKYFALIQGGATQTQNLMALMSNFGTAVDATKTAMDSSGSAAQENVAAMESLQKKIENLKAAWENFATSTVTKEFLSNIIDAGTQLLEFANTDMGVAIAKAVLFGGAITGVVGIAGEFIAKIIEIAQVIKTASSGVSGFLKLAAGGKWTVIALAIGAVAAAIILIVGAIKNADGKFDKFMGKFDQSKQKTEEYQQSLDDAKKKLEELNDIPIKDRSSEQQAEINALKDKIDYYERLIELEKKEQGRAAEAAYKEATRNGVNVGFGGKIQTTLGYITDDHVGLTEEQKKALSDFVDTATGLPKVFDNSAAAAEAYAKKIGLSLTTEDGATKSTEDLIAELKKYDIVIGVVNEDIATSSERFKNLYKDIVGSGRGVTQEQLTAAKQIIDANKNIADSIQARIDSDQEVSNADLIWLNHYNSLIQAYNYGTQQLDLYNASLEVAKDILADLPDTARDTGDAITQVAKALVQNGDLGIDSVEKLKSTLQSMIDDGIFGDLDVNLDNLITELLNIGAIKFDDKNINVETNAEEAKNQIEEVNDSVEDQSMDVHISTLEEGQALETTLQNIADWIDKINGKKVEVTLNAHVSEATQQIDSVAQEINNITSGVNVNVTTNAAEVAGYLQTIQSVAQALANSNPVVSVGANTSQAMTILRNIQGYNISSKSFSVYCSDYASTKLQSIATQLNNLKDKTIKVTVKYEKTGEFATGTKSAPGGLALINDGAPVNGSSAELVVDKGIGQIYNDGEETVQPIPKGAKVYTARQTQDILKDRGLTVDDVAKNPIPALANGVNNSKYPDRRNDPTYSGVAELAGSGEDLKKNFEEWLKEKKHWLNMDVISEAQYYRDLEIMNERYLKNLEDAKDEYWSHEEEIYKYQNQSLEDQIKLEEKLSDLAKAKENRIYALSGGRFQYLQNLDAIAKAQREVDQLTGKYANGTTNARGGLSLVGENGPEMRVLGHGDGIIPAEATKNLMALSSLNIKDALSNIGRAIVTNYSFDISRLELPSVSNAGEFLDGLKNLAYQYSYARA